MRYLYGIFVSMPDARGVYTPRFRMLTNKRAALRFARIWRGTVGRVSAGAFDGGRQYGIDGPTFRAVADLIADYTTR
jgi:hypothetical protein